MFQRIYIPKVILTILIAGHAAQLGYAETLNISYTDIPPTIRVGITGYQDGFEWRRYGSKIKEVIERPFQEYVKNVIGFEWRLSCKECGEYTNDDEQTPGAMDHQKAAAIAVKMVSWWKMNLPPDDELSRHRLSGRPHIVDNTDDHVYIDPACQGEQTPLCKGLTSYRTVGDFRDQAVEATWTTLLKRQACVYLDKSCLNVFEVHYNTDLGGCKATGAEYASFCMPQLESRQDAETFKLTKTSLVLLVSLPDKA